MSPWFTYSVEGLEAGQGLYLTSGEGALEGPPFGIECMGEGQEAMWDDTVVVNFASVTGS